MLAALRLARARPFCFRPASLHGRHRFPRFSTSDATVAQAGPPGPTRLDRAKRYARYAGLFTLSSALGVFVIGAGIFIHDVFTYSDKHIDGVPISPLGVQPGRGGPKNLPIARVRVEDEEIEQNARLAEKPRLVIVGGGWGAMGVLKTLAPGDYHVTLVSPETYTTFTPLLPSAAVGTVQLRSLIEPLRKMIARLHGHYLEGKAVDLVMSERLVEIKGIGGDHFYIPYDKLVIAVGATSSTHGVPGLENCFQLKTIEDAKNIRRRILDNFERASLPTTTREERKRLLSFVICGGGPTGVETAAEIEELCREDIIRYFPKICREDVSIHVVQSREHILNTYSEAISEYAEKKFQRDGIDLITGARVEAVTDDSVTYIIKDPEGKVDTRTIPTNFVLWSTGIAMNPFAQRVSDLLPNQVHKRAIVVDAHLRVKGAPLGEVYAIGDCSTIETSLVEHFMELVNEADKNKDGKIDFEEWKFMVENIKARMPMSEIHLQEVRELFEAYDKDRDNILSLNELLPLLQSIEQRLTALPATAQVASQEGKYVGRKLHRLARQTHAAQVNGLRLPRDEDVSRPFKYFHLGNLAYIGNAAVFDYHGYSLMGGLAAMYAWRSIYWNEQVSTRTRGLLMIDWIIRGVWGRDLSRL